jgi:hypothetical protein
LLNNPKEFSSMSNKRLLVKSALATAVGLAMTQAIAAPGVISAPASPTTFATQLFGTTVPALTFPNVTYATNTPSGIVINNDGCIDIYFRLSGATFVNNTGAPNFAPPTLASGFAGMNVSVGVLSADLNSVAYRLRNATGNNITAGLGSTVTLAPTNAGIAGSSTLASGGSVTITGTLNNPGVSGAVACGTAPTPPAAATALPSNLEQDVVKTLANTASGATITLTQSGAFPAMAGAPFTGATTETQRIDVVNTPVSRNLTTGVNTVNNRTVNLGGFVVRQVTGVNNASGAQFTIPGDMQSITGTLTGTFQVAGSVGYYTNATCATLVGGTAAVTINANNASSVTMPAITNANYANNNGIFVCYNTVNSADIAPTTTNLSLSLAPVVTGAPAITGMGSLYNLLQNGKRIDITSWVPVGAALGGDPSYESYIRIANTGTSGGQLVVSVISSTGAVSNAVPLGGVLASGASATFTSAQVESALTAGGVTLSTFIGASGTAVPNNRPRIRLSGPFGDLRAISFLRFPDGSFNNSGADYEGQ